jgi:integrase
VLADVRRGTWRPRQPVEAPREEPTFHQFASEWYASKESHGLAERTLEDLRWALSYHLLPWFKDYRLTEITRREVDRFRDHKAREGVLAANTINKVLRILSAVLETAVEYELLSANPARGRQRRLPGTRPRRRFVQPEQLMALLEAGEPYLRGRGRPLLAVLAGAGLRIEEALTLTRHDIDLARGSLTVTKSKTDAGVRVVDLTPALRDELALWLDRLPNKAPADLVFPTRRGLRDTRHNIRSRLLLKAIPKANEKLVEAGIASIPSVSPHGLRRTYASLRCVSGDDPVYVADQLGHTDPNFTLRVYAQAVRHRSKLTAVEREAFDRAVDWARMGADPPIVLAPGSGAEAPTGPEVARLQGLQGVRPGA